MKINKKSGLFVIISMVLLYLLSFTKFQYLAPIFATVWIIIVIIHYGVKGGLSFTLLLVMFGFKRFQNSPELNHTLTIAGIFTYICMSIGMGIPISLMKKEQQKRIASEERLRRITDNVQDVIIQIDRNGNTQYISPSCLKILGHEPEYYIGENFYNGVYRDDYKRVKAFIEDAFQKKNFSTIEYRYIHKNQQLIWLESLGEVILDDKGNHTEIVMNCRDITKKKEMDAARKRVEEKIKYLSFHDRLTGVCNRTYIEEEFKRLYRGKVRPLSIIIGDVNGLKLTNDVFGHFEGDHLLMRVANILKESCRPEDIVARWGGDEFVILLPGADEEEASQIMHHILNKCESYTSEPIKISIALGMATQASHEDIRDIIKEAEEKMYRHKLLESRSVRGNIISSLQNTLFERSYETREHADRMMKLGQRLGMELELTENEQDELNLLALLHDIGKIAIKDSILKKPGKLTEDEWIEMKKHTEIGYRIAESTQELYHIADYILTHHERWDGKGYPQGLKGEAIPKLSRALAILDTYDVMTNVRIYKKAISSKDALEEIKRCSGSQFDPEMATTFINMMEKSLKLTG